MTRWFRFYDDVINDPKIMQLGIAMRWHWVLALCCASKSQGLVSTRAIGMALHVKPKRAQQIIDKLVSVGLLDRVENSDTYTPHNWVGRQYKSDVSTDRVKRFRNVSETAPEQIQSRTERESILNKNIKNAFSCGNTTFSIKPGMPEWQAWERYLEHKKHPAIALAMQRVRDGQQKTITVPARLPEDIDSGYAAAVELKQKLDDRAAKP